MQKISLDNGRTFLAPADAMQEIASRNLWETVVSMMDDSIRESVHADLAPCTEAEFLAEYLSRAEYPLIVG